MNQHEIDNNGLSIATPKHNPHPWIIICDIKEISKINMKRVRQLNIDMKLSNQPTSMGNKRPNDILADTLSTVRNAYYQSFETCSVTNNKLIQSLLTSLHNGGFINNWYENPRDPFNSIIIDLKYYQNRPAIKGITQISKPGKRAYFSKSRLLRISELENWGENKTLFLTTPQGVFSHHELTANGSISRGTEAGLGGGEGLCLVW
jgi:small subunit ribosomal protein S8